MQKDAASPAEDPGKLEEKTIMNNDAPTASSAFDFMTNPSASTEAPRLEGIPAVAADNTTAPASGTTSSGFSFLPAPVPTPPVDIPEPGGATAPIDLMGSPNPVGTSTASSFAPPTGAGISFGGASATAVRTKKKKNRAKKIGMGGSTAPSPPRIPGGLPPPPPEATKTVDTAPGPTLSSATSAGTTGYTNSSSPSAREEALEAARKAEEFMDQKLQEQTQAELEAEAARAKDANETSAPPQIFRSASGDADDSIMKAAAAAAKEAQAMSQKSATGARGIMGGLFRRATPPSNSHLSVGNNAMKPASFSGASSRPPHPTTSTIDTHVTKPSSTGSMNSEDGKASTPAPAPAPASSWQTVSVPQVSSSAISKGFSTPPPLPPKPAPKPEPPKPKSPHEQLKAMLTTFRQDVESSMAKVTQLRQQRLRLTEERQRASTQDRLATQQKESTEQQQMHAAETEDYELADQLGTLLETYEKEQKECARMLQHIDMAIQELDNQKQTVVDGVLQCFQTIKTQLETFEVTEATKEHKSEDSTMKKFAAMTKHLAAEHERLQQDLKHLERDEDLVAEERKEVENAISEQSGQFEKDRNVAKEKLVSVEAEVEELRKKLKAKEIEAACLRNDLAGYEDSILQVRVQFSRQLHRVQKKETTIEDHRAEWEAEKYKFSREKESHEAEVAAHSEALAAHEKLMSSLKEEISLATVLEKIVQSEIGLEASPDNEAESKEEDSELINLQAQVVKCEASVAEASDVLKAATAHLNGLEEEMGMLIAKIPQLEASKKEFAANRDFKSAGKASKEIKDATARVKECQEELTGGAVERKETAEKELKKLEEELGEKRKVALDQEKESGVAAMKKLADRIQHLLETKKQICGDEYEPERVKGVGAFVLEEQIKSLVVEGKAYGEKYGGWEELIVDIILPSGEAVAADVSNSKPADKSSDGGEAKEEAPVVSKKSKKERFARCRSLMQELTDIEPRLSAAVEEEDFDLAAVLDEKLQKLMADVQSLDLTDEEMEQALAGDEGEANVEEVSNAGLNNTENDTEEAPVAAHSAGEEDAEISAAVQSMSEDADELPAAIGENEDTPTLSLEDTTAEEAEPVTSGFNFIAAAEELSSAAEEHAIKQTSSANEPTQTDEGFTSTPSADEPAVSGSSIIANGSMGSKTSSVQSASCADELVDGQDEEEQENGSSEDALAAAEAAIAAAESSFDDGEDEEPVAVSSNPSGDESLEPATSASKDEQLDEKKDASDRAGDDGFISVEDEDL